MTEDLAKAITDLSLSKEIKKEIFGLMFDGIKWRQSGMLGGEVVFPDNSDSMESFAMPPEKLKEFFERYCKNTDGTWKV